MIMKKIGELSVIIILIVLGVLIGGGFIASIRFVLRGNENAWVCENGSWIKRGYPTTSQPKEPCNRADADNTDADMPTQSVSQFYSWYFGYEGNPLASGAYKSSQLLSEKFKQKLETTLASFDQGGYDPIICAQDKPTRYEVSRSQASGDGTRVQLKEMYDGTVYVLDIGLVKIGETWQIDEVRCPEAGQEEASSEDAKTVVYFNNSSRAAAGEECSSVYGVERAVQKDETPIQAALEQLFAGPTEKEIQLGFSSFFSEATRNILKSVKIRDRTAYINLTDIRNIIPNASSSCGSSQLLSEIIETVKHDRSVERVIIAIEGNPQTFYDFIQIGCGEENDWCDTTPFE